MITGEFKYSVDEKGRLMIPVKMRTAISGNTLILTRGIENCLWIFPPDEWKIFTEKLLSSTSILQKKARLIRRRIIAPAQEEELDKAGRIMIPPTLREYSGLTKDCVVLGVETYIEVWDSQVYKNYDGDHEKEFQEAVEELNLKNF
ncbi:MAG: division/cell wall cluster transcriptional repressor MraZ [Spirochaetales bacterium]|nr:division/cell wall cluster transcriptional repressor MraZ [Spirochaetales bacterium]